MANIPVPRMVLERFATHESREAVPMGD